MKQTRSWGGEGAVFILHRMSPHRTLSRQAMEGRRSGLSLVLHAGHSLYSLAQHDGSLVSRVDIAAKIQDTRPFPCSGTKGEKGEFFFGWRGAPVTAGEWRLRAGATHALGIPSLARGGKLSQTSDRLTSCGLVDGRRLFCGCGGGGRLLKF